MKPSKRQEREVWGRTRRCVWERSRGRCMRRTCRKEVGLEECHIHHVIPVSCGGTNRFLNLMCLCPHCHCLIDHSSHEGLYRAGLDAGIIKAKEARRKPNKQKLNVSIHKD